jgi:hypothetical protein
MHDARMFMSTDSEFGIVVSMNDAKNGFEFEVHVGCGKTAASMQDSTPR